MSTEFLDLLGARTGLVCAIGAGGKKTTLYALARNHPGRVAITASVFVTHFPPDLDAEVVVAPESRIAEDVINSSSDRIAYACSSDKKGRYAGVAPATISDLHEQERFDVTYVKADGARMRWLKAPRMGEPVLVPGCDTVIAVLSARAIGEVLSERTAHRLELVEAVTGATRGTPFSAKHLASLFTRPDGLQKGTGNCNFVPVINMVDDAVLLDHAREAARIALASTSRFDRVILASMRRTDDPIVAVVE